MESNSQESIQPVETVEEQPQLISPTNYQFFSFEGSGREYFRIWIVNIALTILTLGIYSAWAKVRSNRYIYANTYLNGSNFEYNADPIRILIGRIVVVGFYAAFVIFSDYLMMFEVAGVIALGAFIAMPWLIRQAICFKMRNTSYRNIPFRYSGKTIDFYFFFILHSLLNILTFFLIFPYSYYKFKQLVIDHAHYGNGGFKFYGTGGKSYATFILVFVWSVLFTFAVGILLVSILAGIGALVGGDELMMIQEIAGMGGTVWTDSNVTYVPMEINESYGVYDVNTTYDYNATTEPVEMSGDLLGMGSVYAAIGFIMLLLYLPLVTWYQGFSDGYFSNFVRNFTKLEQASLKGTISPFKLGMIASTNVIAVVFSLGLLYPWAKIRYLRYKIEHTAFACYNYEQFESTGYVTGSTVGEEMTDFFDIDVGV